MKCFPLLYLTYNLMDKIVIRRPYEVIALGPLDDF